MNWFSRILGDPMPTTYPITAHHCPVLCTRGSVCLHRHACLESKPLEMCLILNHWPDVGRGFLAQLHKRSPIWMAFTPLSLVSLHYAYLSTAYCLPTTCLLGFLTQTPFTKSTALQWTCQSVYNVCVMYTNHFARATFIRARMCFLCGLQK